MLEEIYIKDFALIKELRLCLGSGLNIITGETGAGKSIILGALDLLLGSKATTDLIRSGTSRAFVEGRFDITRSKQLVILKKILYEQGLESEDDSFVLKREINIDGRGRSFVNSFQVPVSVLKEIGSYLVDIHGQNEHQNILKPGIHLSILDQYARLRSSVADFGLIYDEYEKNDKKLKGFSLNEQEKYRRLDILQYEISEIQNAKLISDKDFEDLLNEEKVLSNAEVLKNTISECYYLIKNAENSVLSSVSKIRKKIIDIVDYDPLLVDLNQGIDDIFYLLEDLSLRFRHYVDQVIVDSGELENKRLRIDTIQHLLSKYAPTIKNVLDYLSKLTEEYDNITFSSEEEGKMKNILSDLYQKIILSIQDLSLQRKTYAKKLEADVLMELSDLGMGDSNFKIMITHNEDNHNQEILSYLDSTTNKRYAVSKTGIDNVEFFIASSKNDVLRPLRKIASGGEMSRIMLALKKTIIDLDPVVTMVFDEVDAGVGGRIAEAIGYKLSSLSENAQVIVITHLHQIASLSPNNIRHFKVAKDLHLGTRISLLDQQQRIEEIARMLAGQEVTDSALEHAKTLLKF